MASAQVLPNSAGSSTRKQEHLEAGKRRVLFLSDYYSITFKLFQWNCNGTSVCVFVCMYKDASYLEDCLFMSNLIQLLLY